MGGSKPTGELKMKLDTVRIKCDTILKIEVLCDDIGISKSLLVQTILDNEVEKYIALFGKNKEYIKSVCPDNKQNKKH